MRGLNQRFMGTSRTVAIAGFLAVLLVLASGACDRAPDSQDNLGIRTRHKVEAVERYRKAAEQGYADAQFSLGICYAEGDGVAQDKAEAVKWYRKAAEQGYARAQFNLGVSYESGDGVAQDKAEGVKWYRKAAEQGYARAQFSLALCYEGGDGVMQSNSVAVDWYYRAGQAYLSQGERAEALRCYDRIVRISPDHFLALRLREEIYGEK